LRRRSLRTMTSSPSCRTISPLLTARSSTVAAHSARRALAVVSESTLRPRHWKTVAMDTPPPTIQP